MTTESQNKKILAYLMNGKRLTQLDALRLFGCMRLASRICDLRRDYPHLRIKVESIDTPTTGKRIARYYIERQKDI